MSLDADHQHVQNHCLLAPEPAPVAPPRRQRRRSPVALAVLAAAAVVAAPGASGRESAAKVRTLATVNGIILAFAQDRGRFATLERPRKTCKRTALVVRRVDRRRPTRIRVGSLCIDPRLFEFGGDRAAWSYEYASNNEYDLVLTATFRDRRVRMVDELVLDASGDGALLGDIAADGPLTVYSELVLARDSADDNPDGDCPVVRDCPVRLSGGRLHRIGRRATSPIAGSPPTALLALGGGRIAAVPEQRGCACNAAPAWSPEGSSIAYSTRRDGDWEVVIGQAGGPVTRVTHNWTNENDPDWSPDGSRIVYESERKIVVSKRTGTEARPIAAGFQPACSPDGQRIAFLKMNIDGLWLVNPDGSRERRLTESRDFDAAWSPDGTKLATARWSSDLRRWSVTVMDAEGGGARMLTEGYKPSRSPDGESIAYTRRDLDDAELRVIRADGTGDRALTQNHVNDYSPDWSPDGSRIVFVRSMNSGGTELYTVSSQGGSETRVTTTTRPDDAGHPSKSARLLARY